MRRSEAHRLLDLVFDGKDEASINAVIHTLRLSADATHYVHTMEKWRKETREIVVNMDKRNLEANILFDFLQAHCHLKDDGRVQATSIYEKFQDWFQMNISKSVWSQTKFGQVMRGGFEKIKSGTIYYKGLIFIEDTDGCGL